MRYQGGKVLQAKYIVPILKNILEKYNLSTYIEPFVGGGNIICDIPDTYKRYGYDINEYIIAFYQYLSKGGVPLEDVSYDEYQEYKTNKDKYDKWIIGNIGTLASYGGKWLSSYAKDNASRQHYYKSALKLLFKQIPSFKSTIWDCKSFDSIQLPNESCLIYCDAPYANSTQYDYNKNFNFEDYYKWLRETSMKHYVIISEFSMPDDFKSILNIPKRKTLNNKATEKEKQTIEHLFIYNGGLLHEDY